MILMGDGSVWATGDNQYGQLGDGTTVGKTTFAMVVELGQLYDITRGCQILHKTVPSARVSPASIETPFRVFCMWVGALTYKASHAYLNLFTNISRHLFPPPHIRTT